MDRQQKIDNMISVGISALHNVYGNCDVGHSYTELYLSDNEIHGIAKTIAEKFYEEGYGKIEKSKEVAANDNLYLAGFAYGQDKGRREIAEMILKWICDTDLIMVAPDTIKMYFNEHFGVKL